MQPGAGRTGAQRQKALLLRRKMKRLAKDILRTTSTQALCSLSRARFELLNSNRQTVYKTDVALIAEFL